MVNISFMSFINALSMFVFACVIGNHTGFSFQERMLVRWSGVLWLLLAFEFLLSIYTHGLFVSPNRFLLGPLVLQLTLVSLKKADFRLRYTVLHANPFPLHLSLIFFVLLTGMKTKLPYWLYCGWGNPVHSVIVLLQIISIPAYSIFIVKILSDTADLSKEHEPSWAYGLGLTIGYIVVCFLPLPGFRRGYRLGMLVSALLEFSHFVELGFFVLLCALALYWLHHYFLLAATGVKTADRVTTYMPHQPEKPRQWNRDQTYYAQVAWTVCDHMNATLAYLDPHLTLGDIAHELSIPMHDVSRAINMVKRVNIPTFINSYRAVHAADMLSSDDFAGYTIAQIAEMSGFRSRSHFYETFKQGYGVSPAYFRKMSGIRNKDNADCNPGLS